MLNAHTDPAGIFFDSGFDVAADAFLFGKARIRVLSEGSTDLIVSVRAGGVVNQAMAIGDALTYGPATINASGSKTIFGDLNDDGVVTLLDIALFVDLLTNGGYDKAADFDCNDDVDLLDVQPFIDAIDFP